MRFEEIKIGDLCISHIYGNGVVIRKDEWGICVEWKRYTTNPESETVDGYFKTHITRQTFSSVMLDDMVDNMHGVKFYREIK